LSSDDDPPESESSAHITAVVLAAGRGQRLRAEQPKPLFPICGRAMASHVLHAIGEAGLQHAVVVVPPGERGWQIRNELSRDAGCVNLRFAVQHEPRGTADALRSAQPEIQTSRVFVINADLPLITAEQVRTLLHADEADAVIATAVVDDPAKMGRILRDQQGNLDGIVEWRDATAAERAICEVNLGCYLFNAAFLWPTLERIIARAQGAGEAYATDALPEAQRRGAALAVELPTPDGRLNVETLSDTADAEAIMRQRVINRLLESGVQIRDRNAVWIDAQVSIAPGATIEPGCHLRGTTSIGAGSRIGPNAIVDDADIGERCVLESCTIRSSTLGNHVEVGPYSTIRPGCEIGSHVHIGTHAELKQAQIGDDVQIGHFSYLGDAQVGPRTNIGAGAITCNFDGRSKHQTVIGEDAFIGCDTMLIAPLRVGHRATTGAGAVVNRDVPDDGNAVGHPARLAPSRRSRRTEEPARE